MKLDRWSGRAEKAGRQGTGRRTRTPTPIFVSPRVAAVLSVVGAAALAYVLYAAHSILVVALGGTALAVVLSFPVRALSHVMPRGPAILLTFLGLLGMVGLALGLEPKELGMGKHVVPTGEVQRKVAELAAA